MKIAIVGPAHPYKGGSTQHTTELAHRLSAAGHNVSLQSWSSQYPALLYPGQPLTEEAEVPLFPDTERALAWYRPDGWWRTGSQLGRRFDAVLLTVFTSLQVPAYLTMATAARARGCRVVALCHNVLPHERRGFDRPLMQALLRRCDATLVHSADEAEIAAGLARTPVEIAALPLHLSYLDQAALAAAGPRLLRHRLLFFGIVRRYKGLDLLLRALANTKPEISLTVAGEIWSDRDKLLKLISDFQLGEVPAYFAGADALVLPYRSGTASQNALIALQFGVPVIATRAGAIAAAISDGVNGILCEPGDVLDLTRAIRRLYEPGVLEQLQRGVHAPESGLAWAAYIAALEAACSR
jgi:glycosyltransferase involved in cell wall biosynthesis